MNFASNLVEKTLGHVGDTTTHQDISNPNRDVNEFADTTTEMIALTWQGKNHVEMSESTNQSFALRYSYMNPRQDIQTQNRRASRRYSQGHREHHLRL